LYTVAIDSLLCVGVSAQTTPAASEAVSDSHEIIVTARRGAELLQDVPASVSVFTEKMLNQSGITDTQDIANQTAGVTVVTGTAEVGDTQINIRGLNGARDAENSVALVVDGVLKTNTAQLNQIQGRLVQAEVLKGPQGAYYGRNAAAGAIVLTTKKPGDQIETWGELGFGENDSIFGRSSISGPLTDTLGFVVFGDYRKTDGSYRNTGPAAGSAGSTVDRFEGYNIGGRLYSENGPLTLDAKARYGKIDASGLSFDVAFQLPGFAAALGNPLFNEDVNKRQFSFIGNIRPDSNQETIEASLRAVYDLGWATLTGWTLYSDVDQSLLADSTSASLNRFAHLPSCRASTAALFDAGLILPSPQFLGPTPEASLFGPFGPTTCDGIQTQIRQQKDVSAEVRLASAGDGALGWSAGLYYLHIDRHAGVAIHADEGAPATLALYNPAGSPNPTSLLFDDKFKTNVYAAFGSADYEIGDTLDFSAALRFDREERSVHNLVPNVLDPSTGFQINPGFALGPIVPKSRVYKQLQPKVSVAWTPSNRFTLFANWGIGFKAGGFNQQGSNAVINDNFNVLLGSNLKIEDEYRKERTSAFEAGLKMNTADGRLSLEAAAYYTRVTDMQFFEFFTGGFGLLRAVSNIDRVDIKGFEVNTNFRLVDGWTFFASGNVTDSEIKKNASRPDTVGNKSPYTADYTINLGTQIVAPLRSDLDLLVRADYRITGPTWFSTVQAQDRRTIFDLVFPGLGVGNYTLTERDAFGILNLRAGLQTKNWSLTVFADNALNRKNIAEVIPAPEFGGSFVSPGSLRTVGVQVGFDF
jgi:iron complex outermembrane receptor protein